MKIEICNNTSTAACVIAAIAAILTASLGGCHETMKTDREAIRRGLVQKQAAGGTSTMWAKP